jgi:hypothetical protein
MTVVSLIVFAILVGFYLKTKAELSTKKGQANNDKKLGILIDLLYEKYANNVTLDIAKNIISLTYTKTKFIIRDKVIEMITTKSFYNENNILDTDKVITTLFEFVENRHCEDSMFLNKITCKDVKLDFYHRDLKQTNLLDNIKCALDALNIKKEELNKGFVFNNITNHFNITYTTIINKTLMKLEEVLTERSA